MLGKNKDYYISKGDAYFDANQLEKALKEYISAYNIDSNDVNVCDLIGMLYWDLNIKGEAEKYLKEAIDLNSTNEFTYFIMGVLCEDKKDFENAILYLKKSISINDDFYNAHFYLALCYIGMSDKYYKEAIIHLEKVIKLNPAPEKEVYNMLNALKNQQEYEKGLDKKNIKEAKLLQCRFPYYDYSMNCQYSHYQCDCCEIKYKYINAMKNKDYD